MKPSAAIFASVLFAAHAHAGQMLDLGTLGGGGSEAFGINDLGQVVGQSETGRGHRELHAFVWTRGARDGVKGNREMKDLGTLGGDASQANDINDLGEIVGLSETPDGEVHAALWSDGAIIDLGT